MRTKVRPKVFLEAALHIKKQLDREGSVRGYDGCCHALKKVMKIRGGRRAEFAYRLYDTPEFKFFKKLYCNKRSSDTYWFGLTDKYDPWTGLLRPCLKNQNKRIDALMAAYKAAKRLK